MTLLLASTFCIQFLSAESTKIISVDFEQNKTYTYHFTQKISMEMSQANKALGIVLNDTIHELSGTLKLSLSRYNQEKKDYGETNYREYVYLFEDMELQDLSKAKGRKGRAFPQPKMKLVILKDEHDQIIESYTESENSPQRSGALRANSIHGLPSSIQIPDAGVRLGNSWASEYYYPLKGFESDEVEIPLEYSFEKVNENNGGDVHALIRSNGVFKSESNRHFDEYDSIKESDELIEIAGEYKLSLDSTTLLQSRFVTHSKMLMQHAHAKKTDTKEQKEKLGLIEIPVKTESTFTLKQVTENDPE